MNIKDIAKEMTRKEFLNKLNFERDGYAVNGGKILNTFITCPCDINLEDDDCGTDRYCIDCWRQAITDIKFKGEDKVKELTFKEVIANIKEGEKWQDELKIIYKNGGDLLIGNRSGNDFNRVSLVGINLNSKFIKISNPVTFEEVLNSDKKCRVEHELISQNLFKSIGSDDEATKEDYEKFKCNKYMNLQDLLAVLPWIIGNKEFKEIIKNGKWYLED